MEVRSVSDAPLFLARSWRRGGERRRAGAAAPRRRERPALLVFRLPRGPFGFGRIARIRRDDVRPGGELPEFGPSLSRPPVAPLLSALPSGARAAGTAPGRLAPQAGGPRGRLAAILTHRSRHRPANAD
ncbi:unnamed protein product [Nesidiocoris tenuis]|uniref:Uncharacterized protein n=1 Tax=Nesidiocoris tenuis TaxID=355587 RepID=A0A6H5HH35_9HEMI|nr:unnamed protein product [Nesidiocoris tenuis]